MDLNLNLKTVYKAPVSGAESVKWSKQAEPITSVKKDLRRNDHHDIYNPLYG